MRFSDNFAPAIQSLNLKLYIMTKEEFKEFQQRLQQSGQSIKCYLQQAGVSYSTYHYWCKKYEQAAKPCELAPISIMNPPAAQSPTLPPASVMPDGATLLFPNGLRAHFGSGTEQILIDVLNKSLSSHVLP